MTGINITIKQDTKEIRSLLRYYKNGANTVLTRTLNKVIKPVQSAAVKGIAKDMRLTQKVVRASTKTDRAAFWRLTASVEGSGKRIPIIDLNAKPTKKGVTYKGQSGRRLIPSAFISTMPNSLEFAGASRHEGVFSRRGEKRLPIDELYYVSIPHVFVKHKITQAMGLVADERWTKNLDHELKFFLSRAK